jgi:hypothetical protein
MGTCSIWYARVPSYILLMSSDFPRFAPAALFETYAVPCDPAVSAWSYLGPVTSRLLRGASWTHTTITNSNSHGPTGFVLPLRPRKRPKTAKNSLIPCITHTSTPITHHLPHPCQPLLLRPLTLARVASGLWRPTNPSPLARQHLHLTRETQ